MTDVRKITQISDGIVVPEKVVKRNSARINARAEAQRARQEFAATLDALEDKLNVPKQVGIRVKKSRNSIKSFAAKQPVVVVAIASGAAALVAIATVLAVRRANRR